MSLHISPDLDLPLEAVTETFAILAVKRAGKSNAAVVMAEEMFDAGVPWVAVDPKGDWWGVRAAGDGETPGLAVLVFGGLHGDIPLEPTAGRLVADLIAEQRITCVLDVSEMSKGDQRRFLTDFADRLYRRNTEPLHVFCEEADEYIPQRVLGEAAKLVGAFETLVKRGGFRGIGVTLITQRSASLNKDVLTQAGTLIAMRTPSPQDRKAVLAWIDYHAASRDVIDELPTLDAGEAWVFSPQWLKTLTKIRFRRRRTFDSGATPKVGGKPKAPATLADVDLAAIKEQMAETIEKAKADDPKLLRKRIAELERELRSSKVEAQAPEPIVEYVDVPFVPSSLRERIERLAALEDLALEVASLRADVAALVDVPARGFAPKVERPKPESAPRRGTEPEDKVVGLMDALERSVAAAKRARSAQSDNGGVKLGKAERAVLAALVQKPDADAEQLAILAGYHKRSKGYTNALGALRSARLLDGIRLTDAGEQLVAELGLEAITDVWDHWYNHPKVDGAGRKILDVLRVAWPNGVDRVELADRCEYHERSKGFTNALGRLRSLQLVTKTGDPRLTDDFGAAS